MRYLTFVLLMVLALSVAACATETPVAPTLAPTMAPANNDAVAASPTPESAVTNPDANAPENLGGLGRLQVEAQVIVDENTVGYIADMPQPTADWVTTTGGLTNGAVNVIVQVIPSEAGSSVVGAIELAYGADVAANIETMPNGVNGYVDDSANNRLIFGGSDSMGMPILLEVTAASTDQPLTTWLNEYEALLQDVSVGGAG